MAGTNNRIPQELANLKRQVEAIKAAAKSNHMPLDKSFITPAVFGKSQGFGRSWGCDKAIEIGTVRMWGRNVLRLDRAIEAVEKELARQE